MATEQILRSQPEIVTSKPSALQTLDLESKPSNSDLYRCVGFVAYEGYKLYYISYIMLYIYICIDRIENFPDPVLFQSIWNT